MWDAYIVFNFLQSGAFMPVTVGPEGSGLMVVGSMQHYLVKDRHSMYI